MVMAEDETQPRLEDLAQLAARATEAGGVGAVWSLATADLNLNLVRLAPTEEVAPHINSEVDVVGVVVAGAGTLDLDGRQEVLHAGMLFFVPKGARRRLRAGELELVYLTCHRRRARLTITRGGRGTPPPARPN